MKIVFKAALGLVAAFGSVAAPAQVNSSDNGWYRDDGSHSPGNTNTITGECCGTAFDEHRGFWVFSLAGQSQASALSITFFANNGVLMTESGSETIGLYDYTGSIAALVGGTGGLASFTDLGTGNLLGQHTIAAASGTSMPEFTVLLSPAFLAQFNTAITNGDASIALGAGLQTLTPGGVEDSFWFSSSVMPAARLNFLSSAVPEPATWAMMLLGFGAIGTVARKRRARGLMPA